MLKAIFFALLFAASCCPKHRQTVGVERYGLPTTPTNPVLYAKINGSVVRYNYASEKPCDYEDRFPELAIGLEYIGRGRCWTFNGVPQNDTVGPDTYFWRKKLVGTAQ